MFAGHLDGQERLTEMMCLIADNLLSDKSDSVSTLLTKIRQDLGDNHRDNIELLSVHNNKIRGDLERFMKQLSEQSTNVLIEALEGIIRDFNEKLGEQFGENFKRFEHAVTDLLVWQEQYREQVEVLTERFNTAVDNTERSAGAIERVQESTAVIPESMKNLDTITDSNRVQLLQLAEHLQVFVDMREQAKQAVPVISQHIVDSVKTMEDATTRASGHYQNLLADSRMVLDDFAKNSRDFGKQYTQVTESALVDIKGALGGVSDDLKGSGQSLVTSVSESSSILSKRLGEAGSQMASEIKESSGTVSLEMKSAAEAMAKRLDQHVQEATTEMTKAEFKLKALMESQFKGWDESMQQEVTRTLSLLSENLSAVIRSFVGEYQNLLALSNKNLHKANELLEEID